MQIGQDNAELTLRERLVLQHIIRQYIATACPVGSRAASKQLELNLSPASIRNTMADLEEKGFISHPHTSAGRIPTDSGYRFYVDTMMQRESLSDPERGLIDSHFEEQRISGIDDILREASRLLSQISHQLAIVAAPHISSGLLQRIEFVPVSSTRVMVILSITSGLVKTIIFDLESEIPRETLDQITIMLNERLAGLSLREIRETFQDRMRDAVTDAPQLIELFVQSGERLFSDEREEHRLRIEGMGVITQQPEFEDPSWLRNMIELVENQNIIVHVLDGLCEEDDISIRIGKEIDAELMKEYSIVASPYHYGTLHGTISIVGPRRMQYPRIVSLVEYLAKTISHP